MDAAAFSGLGGLINLSNPFVQRARTAKSRDFRAQLVRFESILSAFRAPQLISYLSLDVEGAESLVMSSFPWARYSLHVL